MDNRQRIDPEDIRPMLAFIGWTAVTAVFVIIEIATIVILMVMIVGTVFGGWAGRPIMATTIACIGSMILRAYATDNARYARGQVKNDHLFN